ncbi:ABC transporter type 1, transmembrane domain-containing protein, partial [Gaertneriomyces semiglobifer]
MFFGWICSSDERGPWVDGDFTDCFNRSIITGLIPLITAIVLSTLAILRHFLWQRHSLDPHSYVVVPSSDNHHAQNEQPYDDEDDFGLDVEEVDRNHCWVWGLLLVLSGLQVGLGVGGWSMEQVQDPDSGDVAGWRFAEMVMVVSQWAFVIGSLLYLSLTKCPDSRPSFAEPFALSRRRSLKYLLLFFVVFAVAKGVQLRNVWARYGRGEVDDKRVVVVAAQIGVAMAAFAFGGWFVGKSHTTSRTAVNHEYIPETRECPPSEEPHAGLYSRLAFNWFNGVINHGYHKILTMADVPQLVNGDRAAEVCARFDTIRPQHSSLLKSLYTLAKPQLMTQASYALVSALLSFSGPFFLNRILVHVAHAAGSSPWEGLGYAVALLTCALTRAACDGQVYFNGRRVGMRIRAVLIGRIYGKALSRRAVAAETEEDAGASTGQVTNLMSVDTQKILEVSCYLMYLFTAPMQVAICISLLIYVLGWPALAGVAVMVCMVPLGGKIGKLVAQRQRALIRATDRRITAMNETLQGIRIIKFFAWENHYLNMIKALRDNELSRLRAYLFTTGSSKLVWYSAPILVSVLTFMTFTRIAGRQLTAEAAFTGLALFNALRSPLQIFPDMIVRVSESMVSLKRVEKFLAEEDLERFMISNEVSPPLPATGRRGSQGSRKSVDITIGFSGPAEFSWEQGTAASLPESPKRHFSLKRLHVEFTRGGLNLVCGATGCGKSSMMLALLGEMYRVSGHSHLPRTARGQELSDVAYAAQQAWLMNATIRDNILFGLPYDAARYGRVIHACALTRDLETLEGGDMTEIGEKGVNVSGGQKARISLARAAYSHAEYVLMDDVLSAVDAPTARHIFDECILGLLAGRTRILVTHAVHLCVPRADHIVLMRAGTVLSQGPPSEVVGAGAGKIDLGRVIPETTATMANEWHSLSTLQENLGEDADGRHNGNMMTPKEWLSLNSDVDGTAAPIVGPKTASGGVRLNVDDDTDDSSPLSEYSVDVETDDGISVEADKGPTNSTAPQAKRAVLRLTEDEARAVGSVKAEVYRVYVSAAGGVLFLMFLMVTFLGVQASIIGQDTWLKHWAGAYRRIAQTVQTVSGYTIALVPETKRNSASVPNEGPVNVDFYLGIYALIGSNTLLLLFLRILVILRGSLRASRHLHNAMLEKLLHAPMRFYDITPLGRILNRFSRDMQSVDQEVSSWSGDFLSNVVAACAVIGVIAVVTPVFLIGVLPIALLYLNIARLYVRTSRELKRLESVTRSPIFSHFSETITGASTIRAYGAETKFMTENHSRVDTNHRAFFYLWVANRWLGVRVDFVGAMVSFAAAVAILATVHWGHGMDPGAAGLSLSYALTFTDALLWVVRMHALMEMSMNSVERVQEYLAVDQERASIVPDHRPPADWPRNGE